MYNIDELVGEIVTIKFTSGIEVVTQLTAHDEDYNLLHLSEPRIVVINGEDLALIPYLFTGPASEVTVPVNTVMTIVKSHERSAEDYQNIVNVTDEYQNAGKEEADK
jgi:hypothetical protein